LPRQLSRVSCSFIDAANLDLLASLKTNQHALQTKQLDLETNEHKLEYEHASLLGELASVKSLRGNLDSALRMVVQGGAWRSRVAPGNGLRLLGTLM
jgi:hypothetical protein